MMASSRKREMMVQRMMSELLLARIAAALERLAPPLPPPADPDAGLAFVWSGVALTAAIPAPAPPLALFHGVDDQRAALLAAAERHARGHAAHDVLLWGARGTGKSSLVRAIARDLSGRGIDLPLVQIARDDLASLPALFAVLVPVTRRFWLLADDLAFETHETQYKALRAVLDGGVAARPDNVRLIVTSNRRHLVARDHAEAEASLAPRDLADDRLALADRFGLSLGFHNLDQATYLAICEGYAIAYDLPFDPTDALAWSAARGHRSGRVAWQYLTELAGRGARSLG